MGLCGEAERCLPTVDCVVKIEQHRGSESGAVQRIGQLLGASPLPQEPLMYPASPGPLPTGLGLQVCTHAHPRLLGRHLGLALLEGQVGDVGAAGPRGLITS